MSTSTAAPPLNGVPGAPAVDRDFEFLTKLLQLRDQVLLGSHPRIHLPPKVLEQLAPRPSTIAPPARPTTNSSVNRAGALQQLPPRPDSAFQPTPPTQTSEFVPPVPPVQRSYSAKSAPSGIDPVLLTKSDHLIRAELQLKRQQIERQLKDQFDKKGRGYDADDREAYVDVEQSLIQAQLLVPPVSGLQSTANSEAVDSFDDSYYSSKADSWSPEEVESNQSANADAVNRLTTAANQPAQDGPAQMQPAQPTVIDLDEEPYEPADDIEIYEPEPAEVQDELDEEDYSPPPADVSSTEPARGRGRDRGLRNNAGTNGSSGQQSPAGAASQTSNPRKRKKERRREQANKRAPSPEPYIKEEPQSPPSVTIYHDTQPNKRRALQPIADEVVMSPRDIGRVSYRNHDELLTRPYYEYDEPMVVRVPRGQRDEHELRRVASIQHARRPLSPSGSELYMVPPEPQRMRAASHAFTDRAEVPMHREASMRPSAAPRYAHERSRSPGTAYLSRQQSPDRMPPPHPIVIDRNGQRYYATPLDEGELEAPPARRTGIDSNYGYGRSFTREPTIRASARPELYEDGSGQRMPPPPRRYVEVSDPEARPPYSVHRVREALRRASERPQEVVEVSDPEARPPYSVHRVREASRRASERPQEVVERPQSYAPMYPPPSTHRAHSVRLEEPRREMPESHVRHESIQPGPMDPPRFAPKHYSRRIEEPRREMSESHMRWEMPMPHHQRLTMYQHKDGHLHAYQPGPPGPGGPPRYTGPPGFPGPGYPGPPGSQFGAPSTRRYVDEGAMDMGQEVPYDAPQHAGSRY